MFVTPRFEERQFSFHAFAGVLERFRITRPDNRMPLPFGRDVAGAVELMSSESLIILPVSQGDTIGLELGQGRVEYFKRGPILFRFRLRREREAESLDEKNDDKKTLG